jgi:hypothetical protein
MSALLQSVLIFACILSGTILGIALRRWLPDHHLTADAKDIARLGAGLIGTIAALVLGLLIAGAKSTYDLKSSQVNQLIASTIMLDDQLAQYGPESNAARGHLREALETMSKRIWEEGDRSHKGPKPFEVSRPFENFQQAMQKLSPANDAQRSLKERALQTAADLARLRFLLFAESEIDLSIPLPFLLVLVFWLTIIFLSFSLFVDPNPVIVTGLAVFAISAAGALFLVIELADPFSGMMQISNEPLRHALVPLPK